MAGYGCGPSAEAASGRAGFGAGQVLRQQQQLQSQLAGMPTYEQAAGKEPPSSCAFSRCSSLGVAPIGECHDVPDSEVSGAARGGEISPYLRFWGFIFDPNYQVL